jgi:hypothetical protein
MTMTYVCSVKFLTCNNTVYLDVKRFCSSLLKNPLKMATRLLKHLYASQIYFIHVNNLMRLLVDINLNGSYPRQTLRSL